MTGIVADANTGTAVAGAKATSQDAPTDSALTTATPDDPRTPEGFYWMSDPTPSWFSESGATISDLGAQG
ncbi:hypothetical protein ABZ468_40555 [Streptomyces sp. NPDC005708]|uniref:hypothetical protein n=1 Tax=unclassified Streptomyces TaxID=2593676 RepID=UPI0033C62A19